MDKINLTNGLENKISNIKSISIKIESDYKWGRGWTGYEEEKFQRTVYPALTDNAKFYVEISKDGFSSDTLKKDGCKDTNIYMHPMEFSGFATEEDAEDIYIALCSCPSVIYRVGDLQLRTIYNLNDQEYATVLAQHSKEILEFAKEMKARGRLYDFEVEFIRNNHIPRITDGIGGNSGISSSQTDYKWLDNFKKIMINLGLL